MTPKTLRDLQASPAQFRRSIAIDTDDGPRVFADGFEDWQETDFAAIDNALYSVSINQPVSDSQYQHWIERPRGHSKTSDIALCVAWLLAFTDIPFYGIVCASDKDQAALVRQAVKRLCDMNGWLSDRINPQADKLKAKRNGKSVDPTIEIISADVGSSFGATPHLIIADEICHWPAGRGKDLWDSLVSSSAKRARCLFVCITNAGTIGSWQWLAREAIREAGWRFSSLDGPKASWITPDRLAQQRRLLINQTSFNRLWLNQWQSTADDGLDASDLDHAINLREAYNANEWATCAGLDIGITRDASSLVILAKHVGRYSSTPAPRQPLPTWMEASIDLGLMDAPTLPAPEISYTAGSGKLRHVETRTWTPQNGKPLDLASMEAEIIELLKANKVKRLALDPWQAVYMAQRLRREGIVCEEVNFTAANCNSMATGLVDSLRNRTLSLAGAPPDIVQDLREIRIVEKTNGAKLESPRNSRGHGDRATGLVLAMMASRGLRSKSIEDHRQLVY